MTTTTKMPKSQTFITNTNEENGILSFTLSGLNVSYANSIRRILLSEVPCVVINTFPYDNNDVNIIKNTTRFNNEIIKQRISCIPIHITDLSIPLDDYLVELNEKNDSKATTYVTTEQFKIKNLKQNKYLPKNEVNTIFPPNSLTKHYIDIIRLKPSFDETNEGEEIVLTAKLSINYAKTNGSYNVVSTCFYENTIDTERQSSELEKFIIENTTEEDDESSIERKRNNWYTLDGKRIFVKDSFDFKIKTVGVFPNKELVKIACDIMQEKLSVINDKADKQELIIETNKTTMNNSFDIKLINEDYTLGKVLEYI